MPQDREKMVYAHFPDKNGEFKTVSDVTNRDHRYTSGSPTAFFMCQGCQLQFASVRERNEHWMQNPKCDPSIVSEVKDRELGNKDYKQGALEPIEYIFAQGLGVDFCIGNIIKYATRIKHGNSKGRDIEKAKHYLELLEKHIMGTYKPL